MQTYNADHKILHADLTYGRKLGEGGFGQVFKGSWQHSWVAIKELKIEKLSVENLEKLASEAKIMAELRHDNIIAFRGFCNESPVYALVMEYMPRGSLYRMLHGNEQEIDWISKIQISIDAAAGLTYLHSRNILHRDIKSENLLLHEKDGKLHAKLSDFGLSVLKIDANATTKSYRGFVGTLRYSAPELHYNSVYQKASDVYSYAIMLWEIAARQIPFSCVETYDALVNKAMMGHQEAIPNDAPLQFKEAIESGRSFRALERPTAEEIVKYLKDLMENMVKSPLAGVNNNLQRGSISSPKDLTYKELKLAEQQPANELLKSSIHSLLTIKQREEKRKQNSKLKQNQGKAAYEEGLALFNRGQYRKAYAHFEKAAAYEWPAAYLRLGWLYLEGGRIGPKNSDQSIYWYQKVSQSIQWFEEQAQTGDSDAQNNLGLCYRHGYGIAKNEEEAVTWHRLAAEQGLAIAQYFMGYSYYSGEGVVKDEKEALKWFYLAAKQGCALAQYIIGCCYNNGQGVDKDKTEAVRWFYLAAAQEDAIAQYAMGCCYHNGQGVAKNEIQAVQWFRLAAEQGLAVAQYFMGFCYQNGYGVIKNETKAAKWFRFAAEQQNAKAQSSLGFCYYNGRGVVQDQTEAVKWFRLSAEQGRSTAQYSLACCYQNGRGIARDEREAVKWFRLAAEQGHEKAQSCLDNLLKQIESNEAMPSVVMTSFNF